jgi:hypothetical protein
MKRVGINFWGNVLWKTILFIIIVNITAHIKKPTEKKNQDNSTKPRGTQATGASIFQTIGRNHKGFIVLISCSWSIHLLKMIIVKIDWILTQLIQNILDKSLFIDRNQIAKIRKIFHIPGKKLDFTWWKKSSFTSEKLIKAFAIYAKLTSIK